MSEQKLKYHSTEPGYCRVYFTWKNDKGQTIYYCAQDEGGGNILFYRCSAQPWLEPDYEVKPKAHILSLSKGDTKVDKAVNEWVEKQIGEH